MASGPSENFAGGLYPRNLYELSDTPLIAHVLRGYEELAPQRTIVLLRASEHQRFATGNVVSLVSPDASTLCIPDVESGAAGSALWAIDELDLDAPLVVANGDIVIATALRERIEAQLRDHDATVVTFESVHPRWSYVAVNADGLVVRAREKHPISKTATVGIYAYARARDFFSSVQEMILKNDTYHETFFVCPSLNQLVLRGSKISTIPVSRKDYHSLATADGATNFQRWLDDESGC